MSVGIPFTLEEAQQHWFRIVAGWTDHLDASGARTRFDGHLNSEDYGGSYEGVTRMLWGLGGWLSQLDRPTTVHWRSREYDLAELTRRALVNGTDPTSTGYWHAATDAHGSRQRIVESGQVGLALVQTRHLVWDQLSELERERITTWLERSGERPDRWNNNWALFWALNHASRKVLGVRYDQDLIDSVIDWLDEVYCGNGWYDDGPTRGDNHFDDYNTWVFGSHVLAWARIDGDSNPGCRSALIDRVRCQMEHIPYFYAADGSYPEYGRSLSYKFARLGAPLWAYSTGAWPHDTGMLKRLAGRHLRWYIDRGAVRADGSLRQELTSAGHPDVRETYISTGATYWAMQAFGALWTIPDHDPFWTVEEHPLPVEVGDFVRVLPEPGWILSGSTSTGHVTRYSCRSERSSAKYGKFAYSTAAPFNVGRVNGMPSPDNMISLRSGDCWSHRSETLASTIGDEGWMRLRHIATLDDRTHTIETVIVIAGDAHLRIHRVNLDPATTGRVSAIEGCAPVGYSPGAEVSIEFDATRQHSGATVAGLGSSIRGIEGWDRARRPAAWLGDASLNAVHDAYVLPLLELDKVKQIETLGAIVQIGTIDDQLIAPSWTWSDDDTVRVSWTTREINLTIPALDQHAAGDAPAT